MIQSRVRVTVRYAETDMMGIVYHANYLPWFEVGRTTLLKEIGVPYRKLEEEGFRLPVLEIAAKFLRPAVYDDTVEIVTTVRERPLLKIPPRVRRQTGASRPAAALGLGDDQQGLPIAGAQSAPPAYSGSSSRPK